MIIKDNTPNGRIKRTVRQLSVAFCALTVSPAFAVFPYQDPNQSVEVRVEDLLARMTLTEKVEQMATDKPDFTAFFSVFGPFVTTENKRLGIPPFKATGSSRGATALATAFPVSIARGASWNPELEYRVHDAIGKEATAFGMNILLSPTVNLLRHPGWGRAQETYGEDTFHLGEMAVNAVSGIQNNLMSQIKHFALNSVEENRFQINHIVDERTLREIYLPHFKRAIDESNVASVMSSYNRVNGEYMSENRHILNDILKEEWGFDGFVMSDWIHGVNSTANAANNGLDIEMPTAKYFTKDKLLGAIAGNDIAEETIDNINRRILKRKFEWGLFESLPKGNKKDIKSPEHRQLALDAARESITLLKNRHKALPLDRDNLSDIVVMGNSANQMRLGDLGSSQVWDIFGTTPLAGIRQQAGNVKVSSYTHNNTWFASWHALFADAVIVVASLNAWDEGEWIPETDFLGLGGDRRDLSLHPEDVAIIKAAARFNQRVIVVIEAGSAVTMGDWIDDVEAVVMAWYPGVKGGQAIGEVMFGDVNPSGKTPVTFPVDESQLYTFGSLDAEVEYGFFQGYRYYDKLNLAPQFPFGHGLSYTTFEYNQVDVTSQNINGDDVFVVNVEVTNAGDKAGAEVVQVYTGYGNSSVERAERDLKGFKKISLAANETKTVSIQVPHTSLRYYDVDTAAWVLEDISYRMEIGSSSRDIRLAKWVEL